MKHFGYWFCVCVCVFMTLFVNMLFDFSFKTFLDFWIVLLIIIAPTIISHFIEKIYPKHWHDRNKKIFKERPFEKKFFENIKIKKWKDKIPQMLNIKNIDEAKISTDVRDVEYLNFFVDETCRAELYHFGFILAGMVCWFFVPNVLKIKFGIPILIFWTFFNMLSVLVQRYNRPRLLSLLNRASKKKEKEVVSQTETIEDENLAKNEQ